VALRPRLTTVLPFSQLLRRRCAYVPLTMTGNNTDVKGLRRNNVDRKGFSYREQ